MSDTLEGIKKPNFSQFLVGLGQTVADCLNTEGESTTGDPASDKQLAEHTIGLLAILRNKTSGNLDEDESKLLDALISDLHGKFIAQHG